MKLLKTESNWIKNYGKLPHHITSVLQKRGWISLALKVSSLLVAKNHFVFYFFVILKKRKWFLLGAVLIEILGVKAPPSQSRFPLCDMLPKLRIKCVKIEKFIWNFWTSQTSTFLKIGGKSLEKLREYFKPQNFRYFGKTAWKTLR